MSLRYRVFKENDDEKYSDQIIDGVRLEIFSY